MPTPAEQLWRDLWDWFHDEPGTFRAGPDLQFAALTAEGVSRLWGRLQAGADEGIDAEAELWHDERGASVPVVDVPDAVELVQQERIGTFTVAVHGVRVGDVVLPPLGVGSRRGPSRSTGGSAARSSGRPTPSLPWRRCSESCASSRRESGHDRGSRAEEFLGPIDRYLAAR